METELILFREIWGNDHAGMRLDDGRIFCGRCGRIFRPEEITIVKVFNDCEDFSNAIAELDNLEDYGIE